MSTWILDASVAAAAFFQEEHADAANALLTGGHQLFTPDLFYAEMANVIWKRHGGGEISAEEASQLLTDVLALPLRVVPARELAPSALRLALQTKRTAYDCFYVALAIKADSVVISGDKRLVNALASGPLARHVAWIGDGG